MPAQTVKHTEPFIIRHVSKSPTVMCSIMQGSMQEIHLTGVTGGSILDTVMDMQRTLNLYAVFGRATSFWQVNI
jgi:hypothetical protein